ncbi:hypothetical protein DRJ22_05970 [Candidatus Woesearchaeota archaeon]|nr:MAG: hypothetical protein DRJ22_05970 [Candidatus Woesearchaeota archaeon]
MKKPFKIIILTITAILLALNGYFFIYKPAVSALFLRGMLYYQKRQNWLKAFGFYQAMVKEGTYVADGSIKFSEGFYNNLLKSDFKDKKHLAAIINGADDVIIKKHPLRVHNQIVFSRQLMKYGLYFPEAKKNANIMAREILRKKAIFLAPNRPEIYNLLAITSFGIGDYINALYYIDRAIELRPNIPHYQENKALIMRGLYKKLKEK